MPGLCEVCSKEASKYKCPTCGVSSCSLDCSKSHKANCAPKPSSETATSSAEGEQQQQQQQPEKPQVHWEGQEIRAKLDSFSFSAEAQKLFSEYPGLRARLREIYKITKEEEWNPASFRMSHGRYKKNPGALSWTADKGFNRGVGKVRKWRQSCEGGESTGSDAEGFMKFIALVAAEHDNNKTSSG